jgi:hypothetical protein
LRQAWLPSNFGAGGLTGKSSCGAEPLPLHCSGSTNPRERASQKKLRQRRGSGAMTAVEMRRQVLS